MARREHWTRREVELAVCDYVEMLLLELSGVKFNKAQRKRDLIVQMGSGRTEGSVESKRMNISAAFLDAGLPCIDGYKPYSNYQGLVAEVVNLVISSDTRVKAALDRKTVEEIPLPSVEDILDTFESPPKMTRSREAVSDGSPVLPFPAGLNYLEIDARNALLGSAGEQYCLRFERARLIHEGAPNLADQIEQVSKTIGPSAGYDIKSYESNGQDSFIEVKTTKFGKRTPFFISPHEVRLSIDQERRYQLYRVFKFSDRPGLFSLPGSVASTCELIPSQLKAVVR